jgi:hypothetical protein
VGPIKCRCTGRRGSAGNCSPPIVVFDRTLLDKPDRKSRGQGRSQVVRSPRPARPGYCRGKDPLSLHQDRPGYPDSDPRDRQRKECGVRSRHEAALFRSAITLTILGLPTFSVARLGGPAAERGVEVRGFLCHGEAARPIHSKALTQQTTRTVGSYCREAGLRQALATPPACSPGRDHRPATISPLGRP